MNLRARPDKLGPRLPSPLQAIRDERLDRKGVELFLKRDDLIHPAVSGNKWRKLLPNVAAAREAGAHTLLTFGGAYSNHLRATAAAGRLFGFRTIGIVRGEEHLPLNPSLTAAVSDGMRLAYLDRTTYRRKHLPEMLDTFRAQYGECHIIPEGGSSPDGVRGCTAITEEIDIPFDVIACACGTGGTLAGISASLRSGQRALGIAVLKGAEFLHGAVSDLHQEAFGKAFPCWSVNHGFHHGGYARRTPELMRFVQDFQARHGLQLDWVYEGKLMYGLFQMIARHEIPAESRVVAVIAG